jgi:hypothetical protein
MRGKDIRKPLEMFGTYHDSFRAMEQSRRGADLSIGLFGVSRIGDPEEAFRQTVLVESKAPGAPVMPSKLNARDGSNRTGHSSVAVNSGH